jgi:hypothetical protein
MRAHACGAGADARLKIVLRLKITFIGQVVYREVEIVPPSNPLAHAQTENSELRCEATDYLGFGVKADLDQFAIAYAGRLAGSVPRAVVSALHFESRSLSLAVLIRGLIDKEDVEVR